MLQELMPDEMWVCCIQKVLQNKKRIPFSRCLSSSIPQEAKAGCEG